MAVAHAPAPSIFAAGLLPLLAVVLGCERPAPVASAGPIAQFDFMNGPADLPNVFRGDSIIILAWRDFARDRGILVNAPMDPSVLRACGGSQRPDPVPVQSAGELQDVLRQLRLLRDVNIHVYEPAPPPLPGITGFCQANLVARGTGNATSTDNDRHVTGSGANAFGSRVEGMVDFVAGGSAQVTAERQDVINPDGTRKVLVSSVILHPR